MILWLFGAVALSSAFIIGGWTIAAWQHRHPLSVWNMALMLAIALDIGAVGLTWGGGLRAWDILHNRDIAGSYEDGLAIGLAAGLVSKIVLIWVASVRKGPWRYTALWPTYWITLGLWSVFVGVVR